jgi:hypothetical protein
MLAHNGRLGKVVSHLYRREQLDVLYSQFSASSRINLASSVTHRPSDQDGSSDRQWEELKQGAHEMWLDWEEAIRRLDPMMITKAMHYFRELLPSIMSANVLDH